MEQWPLYALRHKIDMSKNLILKMFEIIDDRAWHSLPSVFHAKARYERPGYEPFVGINRLLDFYRFERSVLFGTHFIKRVIMDENYGASWGRFTGRTRRHTHIDVLFSEVYEFEKKKIKMRRTYFHYKKMNIRPIL